MSLLTDLCTISRERERERDRVPCVIQILILPYRAVHKHPSKVIKLKLLNLHFLLPASLSFYLVLSLYLFLHELFFSLLASGLAVCRLYHQSSTAFLAFNNENTIQQKFAPSGLTVANERRAVLLHTHTTHTCSHTSLGFA